MLDETLLLDFGEHGERLRYRPRRRGIQTADPQIDDVERLETEVREVITNGLAELFRSERFGPISFGVAQGADLGDNP
jgi:hypothetical protein